MMNKTPAVTQSQNLPPWEFKRERKPNLINPGPALNVSVNTSDPMPCLEDGKDTQVFIVSCVQSTGGLAGPLGASQPVIPQSQGLIVLEDGHNTKPLQEQCVQNQVSELQPQSVQQEVDRPEPGLVIENVRMNKGLT
jgi:hypothetical protein